MDIAAVQVQFPGNLPLERFNPMKYKHKIQTLRGWWWPEKIVSERSSKRFPHSLHHNAVWQTLSIKTSFDNQSGFTKRTPLSFRPAQLSYSVITVASSIKFFIFTCIYWPHCGLETVKDSFTISRPRNLIRAFWLYSQPETPENKRSFFQQRLGR